MINVKNANMIKMELNKIYNIDCLKFMKSLPDNYFDLVLTDPPYGINIGKMLNLKKGSQKKGKWYTKDYSNHNLDWDQKVLHKKYFDEIIRISKNQIVFGGEHLCINLPRSRCWIVWDKRVEDKYTNDFADCELAWTSFDKPTKIFRYMWNGFLQGFPGQVGNTKHKEKRVHPTQKPVALGRWLLKKFAKKDDKVFDPFAGSGSFLVACKQLGYNFVGCEINKDYVEIARKRLKQETLLECV